MDPNELAQRYQSWATEDLVRAASFDRGDYLPEAITAIEKELSSRDVSIEDRAQIEQDILKERQETEERINGVHGWLLLLIIIVLVSSLIVMLQSLSIPDSGAATFATTALLILPGLLLSLYGFFVFVLLVRKHKKAPSHAAIWLIGSVCYAIFVGVLIFLLTGKINMVVPFTAAGAFVWLVYLAKSRRVALTYQRGNPKSNPRADRKR